MHQPYESMHNYASIHSSDDTEHSSQLPSTKTPVGTNLSNSVPTNVMCVIYVHYITNDGKIVVQRHETKSTGQQETMTFEVAPNEMQGFIAQQKQQFPNIQFVKNEQRPSSQQHIGNHHNNQNKNTSFQSSSPMSNTIGGLDAYDKFGSNYSSCNFAQNLQTHQPQYNAQHTGAQQLPPSQAGYDNTNC